MSTNAAKDQPSLRILRKTNLAYDLQEFLIDRRARKLASKTLLWYRQSLGLLAKFLRSLGVENVQGITLRRFLLHLQERGHNPGGVGNVYRAVKAFLN